jgi:formyl-CoA transferase
MANNGVPTNWKIYARNKKSLSLELRKPEARDLLLKLLPTASVFIESFRPGTLEQMGLAPEELLALNPKLIIVRISGWGQTGRINVVRVLGRWSKACRDSPRSTASRTASPCCRPCTSRIRMRDFTAPRAF